MRAFSVNYLWRSAFFVLMATLAAGCATTPSKRTSQADPSTNHPVTFAQEVVKWAETKALVEWQVSRLASSCNEVATSTPSAAARREALRLKAAYATSSYAIVSGSIPLVQTLDLTAMATLCHQIWIEEGRAAAEFGPQAKPVELAFWDIRERTRAHALKEMSADELRGVEDTVLAWRKAHPGPVVMEFIRFEAFADEIADSVGKSADLGGLFGRITGKMQNVEMLGERALFLTSRMPRLAEWHAEAAAANVLAQREFGEAMASLKQLGEMQRLLPEQIKVLDTRLAAMPQELAGALGRQPEVKEALAHLQQTGQRVDSLGTNVQNLERSVITLDAQLAQLNMAARADTLQQLADRTADKLLRHARSLILLATGCALVVVVVQALLRRWCRPPAGRN
jgi:hypothetical protein